MGFKFPNLFSKGKRKNEKDDSTESKMKHGNQKRSKVNTSKPKSNQGKSSDSTSPTSWDTFLRKSFLNSNAFRTASSILQRRQSPGFQHIIGVYSLMWKKSKLVTGIINSTPLAGLTWTFVLSIIFTILLTGLTVLYLYHLHANSDRTRLKELHSFRIKLKDKLTKLNCSPLMLRLAWSDCGSYDKAIKQWPQSGGATGSIRLAKELKHTANAGLHKAIDILLEVKSGYRTVSWADAIQMAGALAVEVTGGPVIPMRYGRIDAPEIHIAASSSISGSAGPQKRAPACPILSHRLPTAVPPFADHAPSTDVHIRNAFYRMGLSNREIVALCGAHTIGRAFKDRSGVCMYFSGDQGATKYTRPAALAKVGRPLYLSFSMSLYLCFPLPPYTSPNLPLPLLPSTSSKIPSYLHTSSHSLYRETTLPV